MGLQQDTNLGRPLRADAERNRQRILVAAAEVFARRGLDAGLDEIARHAGVGTGTVYRRFPDKTMLIEALFDSRIDAMIELAEAAAAVPDPWAGLVQFIERSTEMQVADRGLKEVLAGERCFDPGPEASSRFQRKRQSMTSRISTLVDRAKAAGQLRADVSVTDLAVLQIMLHSVGDLTDGVRPGMWRRQLTLLLDGLRAERQGLTPLPLSPLSLDELESACLPAPPTRSRPGPTPP